VTSPEIHLVPEAAMRTNIVLITALLVSSCSSPLAESRPALDPEVSFGAIPGCYGVQLGGEPATDVSLPTLVELSTGPAPLFVEPGRFAVKEPGTLEPRAPISWWAPGSAGSLDLVLGGGYTGYIFTLQPAGGGGWIGNGAYFADFGVEPAPAPLPLQLVTQSCS
jgi:hypothetical protein